VGYYEGKVVLAVQNNHLVADVRDTPPFENREGRGSHSMVAQSMEKPKSVGQLSVVRR